MVFFNLRRLEAIHVVNRMIWFSLVVAEAILIGLECGPLLRPWVAIVALSYSHPVGLFCIERKCSSLYCGTSSSKLKHIDLVKFYALSMNIAIITGHGLLMRAVFATDMCTPASSGFYLQMKVLATLATASHAFGITLLAIIPVFVMWLRTARDEDNNEDGAAHNEVAELALTPPVTGNEDHTNEDFSKRHQRRALAILSAGIFSALSIWFCASAILTPLMEELHISTAQGSFLTSAVNLGFCMGCLASAASGVTDIFPAPVLILVGASGAAVANMCTIVAYGFPGVLVCRVIVGSCLALVYPPGVKLLSTWFPRHVRSTAIGIMFGAFCLGSAFPQLLLGLVEAHSWKPVVAITSAASAVSGMLIHALVPVGPFPFPSARFDLSECAAVARNPHVMLAIVAYCGHMWELFSVWVWAASFLREAWHLPDDVVPYATFLIISMGGLGSWVGGVLGDSFGRVRVAAISLATSGTCVVLLGLLANEGPIFVRMGIFLVWGLSALADSPQFSAIITVSAQQHYVGTAVTLQLLCGYLITILSLWIVPWLSSKLSWAWAFFSLVIGPMIGLLSLLPLAYMQSQTAAACEGVSAGTEPVQYGRPDIPQQEAHTQSESSDAQAAISARQGEI